MPFLVRLFAALTFCATGLRYTQSTAEYRLSRRLQHQREHARLCADWSGELHALANRVESMLR